MIVENVDWVLLPRRSGSNGRIRLAVFIAPRLGTSADDTEDRTLADYPRWIDWPATVRSLRFAVDTGRGNPVPATVVSDPSSPWWTTMFPPSTRVVPFVHQNLASELIATYDAAALADRVVEGHAVVSGHDLVPPASTENRIWLVGPSDPVPAEPSDLWVSEVWTGVGEVVGPANGFLVWGSTDEESFMASNASNLATVADGGVIPPDGSTEWTRFATVEELARIRSDEATAILTRPGRDRAAEAARMFDFHRIVASLGDQPDLMRRLGLVLDLECGPELLDQLRSADATMSISLGETPDGAATDHRLATAVTRVGSEVRARSRGDATPELFPAGERCRVLLFDQAAAAADIVKLAEVEQDTNAARAAEAPALRTAGLRLLQRAISDVAPSPAISANMGSPDNTGLVLNAEELFRGWRIDVLDVDGGRWLSLHNRSVEYRLSNVGIELTSGPVVDEGFVHTTLGTRTTVDGDDPPPGAPVIVSDALATWDGWSLSAPRPGKAVSGIPGTAPPTAFGAAAATPPVARIGNEAYTQSGLSITTTAARGSLPRLRFGRTYRMRLRNVDLAGGGLDLDEADAVTGGSHDRYTTPPTVFRRFEPVPPPVVTYAPPVPKPDDGVDRSGEDERRLVVRTGLAEDEGVFGGDPSAGERILVPPACSVSLAEWHGAFDAGMGPHATAADRAATYRTALRESGRVTVGVTSTPHLVDPASRGITMWGVPGLEPGEVLQTPWPRDDDGNAQPFTIRLEAIHGGEPRRPALEANGWMVVIYLRPAEQALLHVASMIDDLDVMALPHLWRERLDSAAAGAALEAAAQGVHQSVSPAVTIELVHAVPRPLAPPAPSDGSAVPPREKGSTLVTVDQAWAVPAASTGSVVLVASWDRPGDPTRGDLGSDGQVRRIPEITVVGAPTSVAYPADDVATLTSVIVAATPGSTAPATIDLGFTGHTELRIRARGTSRFAPFFPTSWAVPDADGTSPLTQVSDWLAIDVLNSERPPPPAVTEVLPLIVRRDEHVSGLFADPAVIVTSEGLELVDAVATERMRHRYVREGGWLRVWLRAPWNVTGPGEFLAVVAAAGEQPAGPDDARYPYASLIGPDPGHGETEGPVSDPSIYGGWDGAWLLFRSSHLVGVSPDLTRSSGALYLSDRSATYDPQRGEWFVDLQVASTSYFPFVRLAVVRDQPASIRGPSGGFEIRCSPVATLDPIQILPERTLVIDEGTDGLTVWVTGPPPVSRAMANGVIFTEDVHRMSYSVERRVRYGDDLLAWERVGDAVTSEVGTEPGFRRFLPYDDAAPPGRYRLVASEWEEVGGPGLATGGRVVYVETVELPRAVRMPA